MPSVRSEISERLSELRNQLVILAAIIDLPEDRAREAYEALYGRPATHLELVLDEEGADRLAQMRKGDV